MELTLSRETLCFERLALSQREQVSVEGEATLPGSMRDAVTVLSGVSGKGGSRCGRRAAQRARELSGAVYAGGFNAHSGDGNGLRF